MNRRVLPAMLLSLACGYAVAQDRSADGGGQGVEPVGARTRALMEFQSGGRYGTRMRPMPGPVADAVYERYLKSFSHQIPDQYRSTDQDFVR